MQSSNPVIINNVPYPFFSTNLAITTKYVNGEFEANAALRLVPTRLDETGTPEVSEENAKSILFGTVKDMSGPELDAMQKIYNAVQEYLVLKNL
jgi:hypothetical protein